MLLILHLCTAGSDDNGEMARGVEYHLVTNQRNLVGAYMLLNMKPDDGEHLNIGDGFNIEYAQNFSLRIR